MISRRFSFYKMRSITRIQDRTVRILEENLPIVPDAFACSGEVRYLLNYKLLSR